MTVGEITYNVNGRAMKVTGDLGNGFQELIYRRCLAIEFTKAGLGLEREKEQDIQYKGEIVCTRMLTILLKIPSW